MQRWPRSQQKAAEVTRKCHHLHLQSWSPRQCWDDSCVFSVNDLPLNGAKGFYVILIHVIGMDLHPPECGTACLCSAPPLMLSAALQPIFTQQTFGGAGHQSGRRCGTHVFRFSDTLQTHKMKAFNATRMEVKDAASRDSGQYSCMVLPSKCTKSW